MRVFSPATTTGSTLKPDAVHLMVSALFQSGVAACYMLCLCKTCKPLRAGSVRGGGEWG